MTADHRTVRALLAVVSARLEGADDATDWRIIADQLIEAARKCRAVAVTREGREVALDVSCPRCGMGPGWSCVTLTPEHNTTKPHAERSRDARYYKTINRQESK